MARKPGPFSILPWQNAVVEAGTGRSDARPAGGVNQPLDAPSLSIRTFRQLLVFCCCLICLACAGPAQEAAPAAVPSPADPSEETDAAAPAATALSPPESPAPPEPALSQLELHLEPVMDGLVKPLFATHAGDGSGRLFIVEQDGRIHVWKDGTLQPEPFLDLRGKVNREANERGLLGLAFAPNYARSLEFYVNYSGPAGQTRISRFSASPKDPDTAFPESEEIVLEVRQPAGNHNGGMIAFGPDGMLWVGMGDGGGAYDVYQTGQNPASLLGKMLRIDVGAGGTRDYAVPPDNPWTDSLWEGQTVRPEIWAMGLRNPWRFSFDRLNGDLWIADVGQDRFEEVHWTPAPLQGGVNYGWPVREGRHCLYGGSCPTEGLTDPVAEFPQENGVCSITGGYVYRGKRWPQAQGAYIVGDYCNGEIWAVARDPDDPSAWTVETLLDTDYRISSFGEDEEGELYLVDHAGTVLRLRFGMD